MPDQPKPPVSEAARIVGSRIRAQREARGMSLEDLGHQAGIHWTYVGQIERGQRNIGLQKLVEVAHALQVDPGTLVAGLKPVDGR